MTGISARQEAKMPFSESSKTKAWEASTFAFCKAFKKISGKGLVLVTSSPPIINVK